MKRMTALMLTISLIFTSSCEAKEKDPFIKTIAAVKQGIVAVACVHSNPDGTVGLGSIEGTGFFVSNDGTFITAGHVGHALYLSPPARPTTCEVPAIYVPNAGWRAGTQIALNYFKIDTCKFDDGLDLARCKLAENPFTSEIIKLKPSILTFDTSMQKEGIAVAFTGFPLSTMQPITARGTIGTYWALPNETIPRDIVIDHNNWPGASGSPVYLSNGKVIGLLLRRGINEATGFAYARTSKYIEDFLSEQ